MSEITLQSIRERKEKRCQLLKDELGRISEHLKSMGALKIIVFGSYAEDHVRSNSDLDIIAIMPSQMSGKKWMLKVYDEIDRNVDCDILCYTSEEFENLIPISGFVRHAIETGKVIYEKGS
ncbi:TPA: nucleotidyltransferase domain-containing protein [bacterium]|nr:nucleotidyltransferase domain-containing protein [bacterium]